jgi:lysophospholipase L1-like esterase
MLARRSRVLLLAAVALVVGGCRSTPLVRDRNGDGLITVYCLGDSNNDRQFQPAVIKWCDLVAAERPAWYVVNGSFMGTRATGDCDFCGRPRLGSALAAMPIDLVLISLGTNDMREAPEVAVDALLRLRHQAQSAGAEVLVATVPPLLSGNDAKREWVERTNALLVAQMPGDRLIDFSSGMTREDYAFDGIHIMASGQRKCADAALRALSGT